MNVGTNVAYVVLNTVLMIWYVPFLVHHLGVAAYGMIPLAHSVVMYASIISAGLDVSITRFMAIDLNEGMADRANQTFNTALALSLIACVILLIPAGIVTYFFPVLFDLPSGKERETQFLFASAVVTMLFAILSCSFGVSSIIRHRFDLQNILRTIVSLSRVGAVVISFTFWPASVWYVAAAFIISAGINLIGNILLWRRLTPQLHIKPSDIDPDRFRALVEVSGWSSINQVGTLLLMQVDLIIVNIMFGAQMTGRYGSVMLIATLILTMTATVVAVLSPAIMARYALGDVEGMKRIATRSVKLLGIGLAVPVGLLCGFGRPLLTLWLGPEFADLDILLILLVGHLSINLAARPLVYIITAYNRIKAEALLTIGLGVVNIVLAVAIARWGIWGVAGVAAAAAVIRTLKNVVFVSSYSAVVMGLRWWTFYAPLVAGALGTLGISLIGRLVTNLWWPASWLSLGGMAAGVAIAYGIIALTVCINRSDREFLWSFVNRRSHD
jgi:membrane protein EpsK